MEVETTTGVLTRKRFTSEHLSHVGVAPFMLDERLYDVGNIQDKHLVITSLKRREFPRRVIDSLANKYLNSGVIQSFECFYTGLRCWVPNFTRIGNHDNCEFALTKDHAVPLFISEKVGHRYSHIVMCADFVNKNFGHIPLALKLWLKEKLKHEKFDRNAQTKETRDIVMELLQSLKNRFMNEHGLYLFEPWTHAGHSSEDEAKAFYEKLVAADREFLTLRRRQEITTWLETYDTSWIDAFLEQRTIQIDNNLNVNPK